MATNIHDLMKPTGSLAPCGLDLQTSSEVAVIVGGSAKLIDRFVREIAEYSGENVDWHYVGGRARVLTDGNVSKVRVAIMECKLHIEEMW